MGGKVIGLEILSDCRLCSGRNISVVDAECLICRCDDCGYLFDNPRPAEEEIIAYYSRPKQYDVWLEKEADRDRLWRRRLQKVLKHNKPGTLLDVGAGVGQFLQLAIPYFTGVYGTEVSVSAISLAESKYGLKLVRAQIEDADFSGMKFDNICMFHVLEHVPDPGTVLRRCHDLLAPDGLLFIAVPNELLSLRSKVRKLLHCAGVKAIRFEGKLGLPKIRLDGSLAEIHLSHFTPEVLQTALEHNGFSVIETSLDPYYVASGLHLAVNSTLYGALTLVNTMFGRNLFSAMWLVAKKQSKPLVDGYR